MEAGGRAQAGPGDRYGGRYRVLYRLGAGGMATVDLAEDERLGRQVAIKRLRAESSEDAAARFRREAKVAASMNHPNVVAIFDAFAEEEAVLIVMEYVPGGDLDRRLKKREPIARETTLEILGGVAAGLDHAHGQGVVHRDVKPSNVLLGDHGIAKLTDLGVAKVLEDTSATRSGALPGTPLYMAPEQLRGERVTPATDVYSLGLIAFQMLSGSHPRRGGTIAELAHQAVNEPPPDVRRVWPEAPDEVSRVLCRAMDRDPAARPRSATQLVAEIEAALRGRPAELSATPTVTMPLPVIETEPAPDRTPEPAPEPIPAPAPEARETTPPPWLAPPPRERRSRLGAVLAVAGIGLAALLAFLVIGSGDGDGGEPAQPRAGGEQRNEAPANDPGAANEDGDTSNVAAITPGDPASSVQDFYERAAAGDYAGAWELASPNLQAVFGSYESFVAEFSTLESVEFTSLETTSESSGSAQVSFSTVASHTEFTDTCSGTATLVPGDEGWLIDNPGVSCERSS